MLRMVETLGIVKLKGTEDDADRTKLVQQILSTISRLYRKNQVKSRDAHRYP